MRIIWLVACGICAVAAARNEQLAPPTCSDGSTALARGDLYCCVEDGMEYCCMKNDPYHCKRPRPAHRNLQGARAHEDACEGRGHGSRARNHENASHKVGHHQGTHGEKHMTRQNLGSNHTAGKDFKGRSDVGGQPYVHEGPCSAIPITRTAMATLKGVHKYPGTLPRIYTLALAQAEGCTPPPHMAVRISGVEPGRKYSIMVGESVACGDSRDVAWEVAKIQVPGRVGAVQVPSTVKGMKDLRGQTVSLTSPEDEGPLETYACGSLRVV